MSTRAKPPRTFPISTLRRQSRPAERSSPTANPQQSRFRVDQGHAADRVRRNARRQASGHCLSSGELRSRARSIPTIIYIYEKLSAEPTLPAARHNGFNIGYYTSNGYAVLDAGYRLQGQRSWHVRQHLHSGRAEGGRRHRDCGPCARGAARPFVGWISNRLYRDADQCVQGRYRRRAADGHGQHVQLDLLEHRDPPTSRFSKAARAASPPAIWATTWKPTSAIRRSITRRTYRRRSSS